MFSKNNNLMNILEHTKRNIKEIEKSECYKIQCENFEKYYTSN